MKITTISIITALLLVSSCTSNTSLGDFTVISSNNVRGLEHRGVRRDELTKASGQSCFKDVTIVKVLANFATFGLSSNWKGLRFGETDVRIERATKKALADGRDRGVFDADILTNSTIDHKRVGVPLFYAKDCIMVEGYATFSKIRENENKEL